MSRSDRPTGVRFRGRNLCRARAESPPHFEAPEEIGFTSARRVWMISGEVFNWREGSLLIFRGCAARSARSRSLLLASPYHLSHNQFRVPQRSIVLLSGQTSIESPNDAVAESTPSGKRPPLNFAISQFLLRTSPFNFTPPDLLYFAQIPNACSSSPPFRCRTTDDFANCSGPTLDHRAIILQHSLRP